MPKLSIIIPTFNSAATIQRCLSSIRVQTFTDYEIVIQDGKSRDRTVDLVEEFGRENPGIRIELEQETDKGAYDAMNRAMRRACGDWFYFLGSDDELYDQNVLGKMLGSPQADGDVVYGSAEIVRPGGSVPDTTIYDGPFDLSKLFAMNICHQAIFYRAAFARGVGDYNVKYAIWADWDFNLRCWSKGQFRYVDVVVAKYYWGGISNQISSDRRFGADVTANVIRYFNLSPGDPLLNAPSFYGRRAAEVIRARRITPKRVLRALARRLGITGWVGNL